MVKVALLGGGRMGEALLGGVLESGWEPDSIAVAEVDAERRRVLEERYPGVRLVPSPAWAVADSDLVIVAVKPSDVSEALAQARDQLPDSAIVVSIAAGVTITAIEAVVPGHPVVRAMPNTPALIRRGAAAITGGTHATEVALEITERILSSVGVVVRVPESALDAVTGLSGSGPAYVFLLVEALVDAGIYVGLPRETAVTLVEQTVLGAAAMVVDSDEGPEALRAAVTSPGGTTAAALARLEAGGVRAAVTEAVAAATERSRSLGLGR